MGNRVMISSASRSHVVAICLVLLLVCLQSAAICQSSGDAPVKMKISVQKEAFLVGEPILINCEFTNVSNESISFLPKKAIDFVFIGFRITRPDGKIYQFLPGVEVELNRHALVKPIVLSPGDSCNQIINPIVGIVMNEAKGRTLDFVMRAPGTYQITAVYKNPYHFTKVAVWSGEIVSSNSVSLKIVKPQGEDAEALAAWDSPAIKKLFGYYGTAHGSKQLAALKAFVENYPNSAYSDYANYYLAECYQFINPHRFEDAIPQYEVALGRLPEASILHSMAQLNLGLSLCATGKATEGVEVLKQFLGSQTMPNMMVSEAKAAIAAAEN